VSSKADDISATGDTASWLSSRFSAELLRQIVEATLDRATVTQLSGQQLAGVAEPPSREECAARLVDSACREAGIAAAVARALDEACAIERDLVTWLQPADALAKAAPGSPRLRRAGLRLLWALARHEPPATTTASPSAITASPASDAGSSARVRQLQKRLAAAEHERDELASHRGRAIELEAECAGLRQHMESLRQLLVQARAAKAPGEATPPPAAAAAPAVESPAQRLARQRAPTGAVRLGVFLDVANLAGAGRRLYGGSVDFRKLLTLVAGPRRLVEVRAYVIDKGKEGFDGFARALRAAGCRVVAKKPKLFPDGSMKADWDVAITVDVLSTCDKFDAVVLGSGDGDFVPLLAALKQRGLRVELVTFGERTAADLARLADNVFELDGSVLER
jgi:uncharacterized LabA/DUF88 family protein